MRTSLQITLAALAVLLVGAVATGGAIFLMDRTETETANPPAPGLYTNANGADVWTSPLEHLGARVAVTGEVIETQPSATGALIAVRIDGHLVAVHVFDAGFRAEAGGQVRVVGRVRGPLGDESLVPGVPVSASLPAGTTVVDAEAASAL